MRFFFADGLDPRLFVQGQDRQQLALVSFGLVASLEFFLQDLDISVGRWDLYAIIFWNLYTRASPA